MTHTIRTCSFVLALLVGFGVGAAWATPAEAQQTPPQQAASPHRHVISANPFGLMLDFFNAEFERAVSDSATAGVGGSFFSNSGDDYVNVDAFYRYYPSGKPLDGFAFGLKAGITRLQVAECAYVNTFGMSACTDRSRKSFAGLGIAF